MLTLLSLNAVLMNRIDVDAFIRISYRKGALMIQMNANALGDQKSHHPKRQCQNPLGM